MGLQFRHDWIVKKCRTGSFVVTSSQKLYAVKLDASQDVDICGRPLWDANAHKPVLQVQLILAAEQPLAARHSWPLVAV